MKTLLSETLEARGRLGGNDVASASAAAAAAAAAAATAAATSAARRTHASDEERAHAVCIDAKQRHFDASSVLFLSVSSRKGISGN